MPLARLEFNLPEEYQEMLDATAGSAWRAAYEEVWQRLLRPWRKHGYPDSRVQQILESLPTDDVEYLMQYLAQQYRECSP